MGIAVFALWTVNAAIFFLFPIINGTLGSTGTFALFVMINLVSLGFVSKFVPETKGRSPKRTFLMEFYALLVAPPW